jgi:hypothetical protein
MARTLLSLTSFEQLNWLLNDPFVEPGVAAENGRAICSKAFHNWFGAAETLLLPGVCGVQAVRNVVMKRLLVLSACPSAWEPLLSKGSSSGGPAGGSAGRTDLWPTSQAR